jgi:hypothetical protein
MNSNLKLHLNKKPFPHLVIENLFSEKEISFLKKEIDFLEASALSETSFSSAKSSGFPDGSVVDKAKHGVVYLEDVFVNLDHSLIETQVKNLLNQGLFFIYSQIEPWATRFSYCGVHPITHFTKVNFFGDGEKYEAHRDASEFTSLMYFCETPKNFTGGSLHFPEFDFSYLCDNNSLILFPGYILHEVTEVSHIKVEGRSCRVSINTFYSDFVPKLEQPVQN